MKKKAILFFDLDETIINSKHRTPNKPDGTLDLEGYFARKTRENIFKDTLLPLAKEMQRLYDSGKYYVIICTARQMNQDDYDFIESNNIKADKVLSRNNISNKHYYLPDGEYKARHISRYRNLKQFANLPKFFFDDAKPVISLMRKLGLSVVNATKVNARLAIT